MLTPVRRRLAALAVVLLGLGACSYQTDQVYQASVGVNDSSGTVDVLGAVVVSTDDGTGTFVTSLVNNDLEESQTLTGVTTPDAGDAEVTLTAPIEIPAEGLVNLAESGAVSVVGPTPGNFVRLVLTFESGQETEVNVPVVEPDEEFSDIEPAKSSPSTAP